MIIRRLTDALRGQNWLTVSVELLIVAVGVFLGVQFGNWNDRRIEVQQEQLYLDKLEADFIRIQEQLEQQAERSRSLMESADKLRALVREEEPLRYEEVFELTESLVSASRPARPSPTFVEMQASGRLSGLDDSALRSALVSYHLHTEISDRGLSWALEGFHPERTAFKIYDREDKVEELRGAYGEITYMYFAHQLQLLYADEAIKLSNEILARIEENQR